MASRWKRNNNRKIGSCNLNRLTRQKERDWLSSVGGISTDYLVVCFLSPERSNGLFAPVVGHLSQLPARVQAGNYVKELIRIQIQGPHSSQRTVSFPTSLHRSSTIMAKNKTKKIVVRENQWHLYILSSFFFSF